MKRFILIITLTLMTVTFVACTKTPIEESPVMEPPIEDEAYIGIEDYPVMDGSTANLPLMAEIMSQVTGIPVEEAEAMTNCTTTPNAWLRLANKEADILIVYEPADSTIEEMGSRYEELDIIPIGRDALVFINNTDNPVKNLTTQQLVDIYTGKITNWSEVGGNDTKIVPFQRSEGSGSQTLMEKLLLRGTKPMDAPTELKPTEMGGLIDALASYNNSANALGYSVFYYASYMYAKPGLQFISVDGVAPGDESIAAATYPFLNEYYVVIRADEPENSPARKLRDWIISDKGLAAMAKTGYIANK